MKGKKLNLYVAALVITVFGAGATMLIVSAASDVAVPEYANVDPFSPTVDFGH
ncbi:hypothetical protein KJ819_00415 [Patescibacteria group bacterium]|nr:hypothetical protein [Patescibacteria group bacterium]MBU1501099.1 hypothetical protein [Patescibacteria group bacterium]MBU2081028.1 hypothetical protein [Patescibacteria group bacterium]MBU2124119.1 hypothetical protein [Patescibacteria group bacterium]MBU2194975.1 hypothetical protein [Patescibacteria group bacterium]